MSTIENSASARRCEPHHDTDITARTDRNSAANSIFSRSSMRTPRLGGHSKPQITYHFGLPPLRIVLVSARRADHDPPPWVAKIAGYAFGSNPLNGLASSAHLQ